MAHHNELGKLGEDLAIEYLTSKGYLILARNFRFKKCEIDIIASFEQEIIFVEVKTRSKIISQYPENAITSKKLSLLYLGADEFLHQNNLSHFPARFDSIAISFENIKNEVDKNPEIVHQIDFYRPDFTI